MAANSCFPICFVTESTQPQDRDCTFQVLHGHALHVAQCVPYIQHELQRTLTSQNILLEDTLKSSPPEPENTPRAGSPPQRSSISSALRRGHCEYGLCRPLCAPLRSEEPVHQSCCFQRDRYKIQFGSIHRYVYAGYTYTLHIHSR